MNHPLKCLIVDDEPLAIELIRNHAQKIPALAIQGSYQDAMKAHAHLQRESIDLIFLDIQMPLITGVEFIKSLQHAPKIILTTAYRQYAVESYELNVVDYLLKPITFERFLKAVNKLMPAAQKPIPVQTLHRHSAPDSPTYLYVTANRKSIKVHFKDIDYIESLKDYILIDTGDKQILTKEKISEFIAKLPAHFLRVHRSFIVNLEKISAFSASDIEVGEKEIPIGISYKQIVHERIRS